VKKIGQVWERKVEKFATKGVDFAKYDFVTSIFWLIISISVVFTQGIRGSLNILVLIYILLIGLSLESCNHTFHTRRNEEWKTIRRA
jgi:cell division protein FtsW (lipid II flippase)